MSIQVKLSGDDAARAVQGLNTCAAQLDRASKQLHSAVAKRIYKENAAEYRRIATAIAEGVQS